MPEHYYHFTLTASQANAVIRIASALELAVPLGKAADRMDEQMAQQSAQWERCEACNGSGWVEE